MKSLSEMTRIKIMILENGVKFKPISLFTSSYYLNNYKMKTINKHPVSNGKEVYDISTDLNLVPSEILLKDNNKESLVKCRYNENSLVELVYINNELKILVNNIASKVQCELVQQYKFLKSKVNKDYCVNDYVDIVGMDRISILLYEGCYNWICGNQCHFCDLHPKKINDNTTRPTVNTIYKFKNITDWWNFYKKKYFNNIKKSLDIILQQKILKHKHLLIMAGNLTNLENSWKFLLDLVKYLNDNFDMSKFDSIVNICPHPDIEKLKLLKNYGIKQVQYNLEVSDSDLFAKVCPGKIDFEIFKKKLFEAVKVFGNGNVRSNMVLGLQNVKSLLADAEIFAKQGVVIDYSVFQPKKFTPLENYPSPSIDKVLDFSIGLAKIYKKYRLNPIYCSVSSRSSIINEVFNDFYE